MDLIRINKLSREEQLRILQIRNEDGVRSNMYTDHVISEAEHFKWIETLGDSTIFYAVKHEGEIVGGASLSRISKVDDRADWAFYLSEKMQGKGLGSRLEFAFLELAFEQIEFHKLNCEVLEFNVAVIALHKKFGFIEEGCRRAHIRRNGKYIDTRLLGMTRDEWRARRRYFVEKFA